MKITKSTTNFIVFSIYMLVLFCGVGSVISNEKIDLIRSGLQLMLPFIILIFIMKDQNYKHIELKKYKLSLIIMSMNIIWFIITIFFGINIGLQSVRGLINFSSILLLLFFMSSINFTKEQQYSIKKAFILSCLICSIYGIIQYFFRIDLNVFENEKYPGIFGRINSTFYIATLLDKYMVLMFAFSCYNLFRSNLTIYKVLFILTGLNVILTFSRAGLISFLLVLGIFVIKSAIDKKYKKILLSVVIIVISFLLPGVNYLYQNTSNYIYDKLNIPESLRISFISPKFDNKICEIERQMIINSKDIRCRTEEKNNTSNEPDNTERPIDDMSIEFRKYYNSIGMQLFKERISFGIGLNNYSYLYNNQNANNYIKNKNIIISDIKYMYPHNGYIQLGAETGIIGLVLFFTYLFYFSLFVIKKSNNKAKFFSLLLLLLFLIGNYSESLMFNKQYMYVFVILFGFYSNVSVYTYDDRIKSKKKKITFLMLHLGRGGIETATINTANSLCKKYEISLISLYTTNNEIIDTVDKRIKIVHLLNYSSNRNEVKSCIKQKKYFKLVLECIKAIKVLYNKKKLMKEYIIQSTSDIIISTRMEFSILLNKYGSEKTKKIACEHQHHNNDSKYIYNIKHKYNNLDYLVALTNSLANDYSKFLKRSIKPKVITIPNMIPDCNVKISNLNNNRIVSIGRLHPGKHIGEALEIYNKSEIQCDFDIAGDGVEYNKLEKYIFDNNLQKRVHLLGSLNRDEVNNLLSKSDIFVMTSISEGLPMVLIEAMRCGVICIAYETDSGVNDIIEDSKNGYIIKNRNQEEFIEKMKFLLSHRSIMKQMQKMAIRTSKKYSSKEISKQWINILEVE